MKVFLPIIFSLLAINTQLLAQSETSFDYVDFIPNKYVKNPGDTLFIDLDNDGIKDFKFYLVWGSAMNYCHIGSCSTNNKLTVLDTSDTRLLTDTSIHYGYSNGFFVFPDKKYLACQLERNGVNYYGWILYYGAFPSQTEKNYLYVDKYAFCKIPNYGIRVGQTSKAESTGLTDVSAQDHGLEIISAGNGLAVLAPLGISEIEVFDNLGRKLYDEPGQGLPVHNLPHLSKNELVIIRAKLVNGLVLSKKIKVD